MQMRSEDDKDGATVRQSERERGGGGARDGTHELRCTVRHANVFVGGGRRRRDVDKVRVVLETRGWVLVGGSGDGGAGNYERDKRRERREKCRRKQE